MDTQKEIELFEELLLANPDFDESLLAKDEDSNYEDCEIEHQLGIFQAGIEVAEREARMSVKAQAVLKSPVMAFDEWFKKRHEKSGLYEEALCGKDDATYIKHEMNKAFQAGWKEKQVPESNALLSAAMDAVQKLGSGDFVLVPRVITDEWMAVYVDPVVTKYCKDYEDLPFSVEESELPEIQESHRLPIRNAHKRLMQVIEAQEQSHD